MSQLNFKQQILSALDMNEDAEDNIECFIVDDCQIGWGGLGDKDPRNIPKEFEKQKLNWNTHSCLLDYITDKGYGGLDCHIVRVYTEKWIYYIHEYDGSHSVESIERNPS